MSGSCPLCNGEGELQATHEVSVTSGSRVLGKPSMLWLCRACGHAHTSADIDWVAYYAEEYDSVLTDLGPDELVALADGSTTFRTEFDYGVFRQMVGSRLRPENSILEFGAGRGRILSRLCRDGFDHCVAYDVSELYREPLGALVGSDRVFISERPAARFDAAISFFALEHDTDPAGSLEYLHASLAPGGLLFLALPNPLSNLGDFACADHVQHFLPTVLRRLVESVGFDAVELDVSHAGMQCLVARRATDSAAPPALVSTTALADGERLLEPYRQLKARLDVLAARIERGRSTYLYGAGFYATLANAMLTSAGMRPAGVFDANPHKQGTDRFGCRVRAPASIERSEFEDSQLVLCVNGAIAGSLRETYKDRFHRVVAL